MGSHPTVVVLRPERWQKNFKFRKMSVFGRLRKLHEEKCEFSKLRSEHLFLAHGAMAVDLPRDCGDRIPSRRHG
jgi:hypothetical protein